MTIGSWAWTVDSLGDDIVAVASPAILGVVSLGELRSNY